MYKLKTPQNYVSKLTVRETEKALKFVKDTFQKKFIDALSLERISAPLFVKSRTGINDDLNGVERAVRFDIKEQDGVTAEIVHSLAKWKRVALAKYGFKPGEGIYTDMNAIRRDDHCDNQHSIYVDQWDWEMVITAEQRKTEFLQEIVKKIVGAICDTLDETKKQFKQIDLELCRDIKFITTQELEDMYPDATPKERESLITKEYKTVFLMCIGGELKSGEKHDGRAPDYDDWKLNGDILFWDEILGESIELSSMGIRVDGASLRSQLEIADCEDRLNLEYHKGILSGKYPLTIGGGIGQSRLCMLLLQKAHIGEVQVSLWPDEMVEVCHSAGIWIL
ncbi:MAG: aspartate--ammonia ligase [Eubacteriales bacterium]|nr:aspartate--ammonia ligase [Bacillota bacterium]MDY4559071.1 aspartate--ammonia ligase [Eubacteriales bacterium]MDY5345235.1 aspartate--ammonia ligase [Eubacteriales bacterium]